MPSKNREKAKTSQYEKDRRKRLSDNVTTLGKLLPTYDATKKFSMIETITKAIEHIKELQEKIKGLLTDDAKEKDNAKQVEFKKLYTRIKHLLTRNERLSVLLRNAGVASESAVPLKRSLKWSNKIPSEKAKELLAKGGVQKENKPKGSKSTKQPPRKRVPKEKNPLSRKIKKSKATGQNTVQYLVTNSKAVKSQATVVTNSPLLNTPIFSTVIGTPIIISKPNVFPQGTIILTNNIPFAQPPTVINQPLILNPPPGVLVVNKKTNQNGSKIPVPKTTTSNAVGKVPPLVQPKGSITKTTQINKLPIPASRYATNYILLSQVPTPPRVSVKTTFLPKKKRRSPVKRKVVDSSESVAAKKVKVGEESVDDKKVPGSDHSINAICKENEDEVVVSSSSVAAVVTTADSAAVVTDVSQSVTVVTTSSIEGAGEKTVSKVTSAESNNSSNIATTSNLSGSTTCVTTNVTKTISTTSVSNRSEVDTKNDQNNPVVPTSIACATTESGDKNLGITKVTNAIPKTSTANIIKTTTEPQITKAETETATKSTVTVSEPSKLEQQKPVNPPPNTPKTPDILPDTLEPSELSNDIFATLQVPTGGQNPESTSPTAAFLNAFPLVSSFTGVKVTEVMEDETSDSRHGTPTLLQIGTMDSTKTTHTPTDSLMPSLLNLDSFTLFSSKDFCNNFYGALDMAVTSGSSLNVSSIVMSTTTLTRTNETVNRREVCSNVFVNCSTTKTNTVGSTDRVVVTSDIVNKGDKLNAFANVNTPRKETTTARHTHVPKIQNDHQAATNVNVYSNNVKSNAANQMSSNQNNNTVGGTGSITNTTNNVQNHSGYISMHGSNNITNTSVHNINNHNTPYKSVSNVTKITHSSAGNVQNTFSTSHNADLIRQHSTSNTNQTAAEPNLNIHHNVSNKSTRDINVITKTAKILYENAITDTECYKSSNHQPNKSTPNILPTINMSTENKLDKPPLPISTYTVSNNYTAPFYNNNITVTQADNSYSTTNKTNKEFDKTSCSRYSSYNIPEYNTFNPFTDVPKCSVTCSYATTKTYTQPTYTNTNCNYNYQPDFNTNYTNNSNKTSTTTINNKTDRYCANNNMNYESYDANNQYNYYNPPTLKPNKLKNTENIPRPPVNWMTTPDLKQQSSDFIVPTFVKETEFIPTYTQNNFTTNPQTYFNASTAIYSTTDFFEGKKLDAQFTNTFQKNDDDNQFTWSPTKLPQLLDPSHSFVATTLPTLVGDLALGNTQYVEKHKAKKDRRNVNQNFDASSNFLSVSQLVDHSKTEGSARISTRRNSGGRSKAATPKSNKRVVKADINFKQEKSHVKNLTNSFNEAANEWAPEKRVKNPPSSYSAEALIGHPQQPGGNVMTKQRPPQQQSYSKSLSVTSFLPDNLITYFPPVDIQQDNNFTQQNQNYQNHSFPSSMQNNTYSTSFIPNPTTTYLPSSNFIPDITDYTPMISDNIFSHANPKIDNKQFNKNTPKTPTKQIFNNTTPKKSKKKSNNDNAPGFVDFSFLSMPGAINSPILPDDFHTHTNFLPPPPPPNPNQLYPCKNPLYPKQGTDLGAALLPLPSVTRANLQHAEVSPSMNTGGTSLTNFNLSTIFPEINKSASDMYIDPTKNKDYALQRTYLPSTNQIPSFSKAPIYSSITHTFTNT